ncbi:MAG: preprotein translocase subunit SecE [Phycisphaerales bacterium]
MTAIAGGVLAALGAAWLWEILIRFNYGKSIEPIYVAAAAALALLGLAAWFIYRIVATKPGSVDFLVATETEMKKVNWSTRREIFGSTWVVLMVTAGITLFVFVFDYTFFFLFVWMRVLDAAT